MVVELSVYSLNSFLSFHMHFPVVFIHAHVHYCKVKNEEWQVVGDSNKWLESANTVSKHSSSTSAVSSINHMVQHMNPGLEDHLTNKEDPKTHNQSSFFTGVVPPPWCTLSFSVRRCRWRPRNGDMIFFSAFIYYLLILESKARVMTDMSKAVLWAWVRIDNMLGRVIILQ